MLLSTTDAISYKQDTEILRADRGFKRSKLIRVISTTFRQN